MSHNLYNGVNAYLCPPAHTVASCQTYETVESAEGSYRIEVVKGGNGKHHVEYLKYDSSGGEWAVWATLNTEGVAYPAVPFDDSWFPFHVSINFYSGGLCVYDNVWTCSC